MDLSPVRPSEETPFWLHFDCSPMRDLEAEHYHRYELLFQLRHHNVTDTTLRSEVWAAALPVRESKNSGMTEFLTHTGGIKRLE